jgi:hypothetical protein
MNGPLLSVLLPNYNHASTLPGALGALLSQRYDPFEIVAVDDGSTDESVAILAEYARRDHRVRLFENGVNLGVNATLNRALAHARGDWVYGSASDDLVLPGFFEKSMGLLLRHPHAALCCSNPASFDDATGTISDNPVGWSRRERYFAPRELARVMRGRAIAGHTAIARRDCFGAAGGWAPGLRWYGDWFALLVMGFRHGVCFLPETLALFRETGASYSWAGLRHPDLQAQALGELLERLQSSEFRDLLPYFSQSGVLSPWALDVARVLARRGDLRSEPLLHELAPVIVEGCRQLVREGQSELFAGLARLLADVGPAARRAATVLARLELTSDLAVERAALDAWQKIFDSPQARLFAGAARGATRAWCRISQPLRPFAERWYQRLNSPFYWRLDNVGRKLNQFEADCRERRDTLERAIGEARYALAHGGRLSVPEDRPLPI